MVSAQKNTKKRKFANPYNQNNNENRQPPKPKSKVVNPSRQQFMRPMQSKPTLQPQMVQNAPNQIDQNQFYNQRPAPRYHNNTNGHQQNPNFQNGYQQYVSQQYINPQPYYGQQNNSFMRQQQQGLLQLTLTTQMQQGFHNLNTVELMRMRQMIQSELYYLRIQNETNYYQSVRPVNCNFF